MESMVMGSIPLRSTNKNLKNPVFMLGCGVLIFLKKQDT